VSEHGNPWRAACVEERRNQVAKKEKPVVEEVEDAPVADEAMESNPVAVDLPVEAEAGPVVAKRSIGPKEPIPFKWKILGTADRYVLTLFKSVEREDAEAQLERLAKEGYYTSLRIADISEKIEQPVQKEAKKPKAAKKEPTEKAAKPERLPKPQKTSREEKASQKDRAGKSSKAGKTAAKPAKRAEKPTSKSQKSSKKKSGAGKSSKGDSKRR